MTTDRSLVASVDMSINNELKDARNNKDLVMMALKEKRPLKEKVKLKSYVNRVTKRQNDLIEIKKNLNALLNETFNPYCLNAELHDLLNELCYLLTSEQAKELELCVNKVIKNGNQGNRDVINQSFKRINKVLDSNQKLIVLDSEGKMHRFGTVGECLICVQKSLLSQLENALVFHSHISKTMDAYAQDDELLIVAKNAIDYFSDDRLLLSLDYEEIKEVYLSDLIAKELLERIPKILEKINSLNDINYELLVHHLHKLYIDIDGNILCNDEYFHSLEIYYLNTKIQEYLNSVQTRIKK